LVFLFLFKYSLLARSSFFVFNMIIFYVLLFSTVFLIFFV
jgi:hypothetical protein